MNKKIKASIKTGDIYKIRSAYKKEGMPKCIKLSQYKDSTLRTILSSVMKESRRLTSSEAKSILIKASKIVKQTPFKKRAGILDVLKIIMDLVSPYTWLFIKDARLNTAFKMLSEYVGEMTKSASLKREAISTIWPPTDMSKVTLEMLRNEGYEIVTWESSPTSLDMACAMLDGEQWNIDDFISGLSYNAPIFEKSHVGCKCRLIVSGKNLKDEIVTAY